MKKSLIAGALALLVAVPFTAMTQATDAAPADSVIPSLKGLHEITKTNIMRSAEMLDEALYSFRPTEEVRTVGQLFGHIANAQGAFCSAASGMANPLSENFEQRTSKAGLIEALNMGFEFCEEAYASMTDAKGAEMVSFFGSEMAASAVLAFNSAHNYEHYGNLVTYMRINGIVPPSSMPSGQ